MLFRSPGAEEGQPEQDNDKTQSEEQGGTDTGRDTDDKGTGAPDTDAESGSNDGARREPGVEREDHAEVDYSLEIEVPMPYGMEKMTVGQLKDTASDLHLRQERLDKQSNDIMTERDQVFSITSKLAPYLTPEVEQMVQQYRHDLTAREGQRMLEAIPEWKEQSAFTNDRTVMKSLAGEYGFSEREFNQVIDHRLVKLLRDYTLLRNRVHKAKEEAKPLSKGKQTKPGHKKPKAPSGVDKLVQNATASTDQAVKDAAISKLIEDS